MKDPNGKVVMFQWVVIAVLVIGAGIGGYMLYQKTEDYSSTVDSQQGEMNSLRRQLDQARSTATPVPEESSLPESSANKAGATPTPSPSASPKASATPTPTTTP